MIASMLLAADKIDVSKHLPLATDAALWGIGLLILFFVVRFDLWRRLWFDRVDPRPAALMRIAFGTVVFITFFDLLAPNHPLEYSTARYLFTDDGLWLTDMARKNYGGDVGKLWDPDHGFERWTDMFKAMWGKSSILHLRSDPFFVFTLYAIMLGALASMIVGWRTRTASIVAFVLVEMFYRYSPIFYTGGDTVVRIFLFLGMLSGWGNAYSIDSWRRRRKAILRGAKSVPALRKIAAWPMRLMMLQLCIIYSATGMLKSGDTWANGDALYFALNLDHFYRVPQQGPVTVGHYLGILPLNAIVVRWWEVFFPLVGIGAAVNAYERGRKDGSWPVAPLVQRILGYLVFWGAWGALAYVAGIASMYYLPPELMAGRPVAMRSATVFWSVVSIPPIVALLYIGIRRFIPQLFDFVRHFIIGKRFWLVFGFGVHIGIDVGMNVGTFAEVMMAVYLAWLSGPELDQFWSFVYATPCKPGEGGRPRRPNAMIRHLATPFDWIRFRKPGSRYTVRHNPAESSVRRAALLRIWDLGDRLAFVEDESVAKDALQIEVHGRSLSGNAAAAELTKIFAGLTPLRPFRWIPGAGVLARVILRQRT